MHVGSMRVYRSDSLPGHSSILMLIKRRPAQFSCFVEKKYRHEHVMITNLYFVSHISCMTAIFINAFYELFADA